MSTGFGEGADSSRKNSAMPFNAILTNKLSLTAPTIFHIHNGRDAQAGIFGALKADNQTDCVASRT